RRRTAVHAAAGSAVAGRRRAHRRGHAAGGGLLGPGMSAGGVASGNTVLGFDVGARRIGVAVGSSFGHGARALAVIDVHDGAPDWRAVDRLREEWRPDALVVGDPMTLDDGDQPNRKRAQRFARRLRERYALPVARVGERPSARDAA